MKANVGTVDRVIRIVAGLILLSLAFILEGNARWWGLVGLLPLATGLIGWCALYVLEAARTEQRTLRVSPARAACKLHIFVDGLKSLQPTSQASALGREQTLGCVQQLDCDGTVYRQRAH